MPVKARLPKGRRPSFTPETLALFLKLEGMSERSQDFEEGSRELARMLGLTDQWWTRQHVNDRSEGPCHPPWCVAHEDWYTCREVREALLTAASTRPRIR